MTNNDPSQEARELLASVPEDEVGTIHAAGLTWISQARALRAIDRALTPQSGDKQDSTAKVDEAALERAILSFVEQADDTAVSPLTFLSNRADQLARHIAATLPSSTATSGDVAALIEAVDRWRDDPSPENEQGILDARDLYQKLHKAEPQGQDTLQEGLSEGVGK